MYEGIYTICPRCEGRVNITEQLDKFAWMLDQDSSPGSEGLVPSLAVVSLYCQSCQEYTLVLSWEPREGTLLDRAEATINQEK